MEDLLRDAGERIHRLGEAMALPRVAAWANLATAAPVAGVDGQPMPSQFRFTDKAQDYWREPDLALRNAVVAMVRCLAEPFFYDGERIGGWRPLDVDQALLDRMKRRDYGVRNAIVAPVHLPRGVIGAVVWATGDPGLEVGAVFQKHAAEAQIEALRFLTLCDARSGGSRPVGDVHLTRREIQCLKLMAAGKTDGEVAAILGLATPTVRFHLKNAGTKLGREGRLRIVRAAGALGYIGEA